jgi:hypothetical protein
VLRIRCNVLVLYVIERRFGVCLFFCMYKFEERKSDRLCGKYVDGESWGMVYLVAIIIKIFWRRVFVILFIIILTVIILYSLKVFVINAASSLVAVYQQVVTLNRLLEIFLKDQFMHLKQLTSYPRHFLQLL